MARHPQHHYISFTGFNSPNGDPVITQPNVYPKTIPTLCIRRGEYLILNPPIWPNMVKNVRCTTEVPYCVRAHNHPITRKRYRDSKAVTDYSVRCA